MNDTRKQIIELISDYMDKSFEIGLLIRGESKHTYFQINEIKDYELKKYKLLDRNGVCNINDLLKFNGAIVGHYDITAVLKYMYEYIDRNVCYQEGEEPNGNIEVDENMFGFSDYKTNKKCKCGQANIGYKCYNFPNKPLHLYTEQEEKDLLELLTKLK